MFVSGRGQDAGPKQACSAPAIGGPWEAAVSSETGFHVDLSRCGQDAQASVLRGLALGHCGAAGVGLRGALRQYDDILPGDVDEEKLLARYHGY